MGIVSTWLNGIGLSSAVPTFQAAGIVTPEALAELDVAHFEALGITNADDRRKLFYLVQRIKIAKNSTSSEDKKKMASAEEQVDAVLNKSPMKPQPFSPQVEQQTKQRKQPKVVAKKKKNTASSKEATPKTPQKKPTIQDPPTTPEPPKPVTTTTRATRKPAASATARLTTPIRRSTRLAIKQSSDPPVSTKENKVPITGTTSPHRTSQKATPDIDEPKKSPGRPIVSKKNPLPVSSPPRRMSRKVTPVETQPTRGSTSKNATDVPAQKPNSPKVRPIVSRARPSVLATEKEETEPKNGRVVEPQRNGKKVAAAPKPTEQRPTAQTRTRKPRKSGLKLPTFNATSALEATVSDSEGEMSTPVPSNGSTNRRPESRLLNPGTSTRTGKRLSVIPAESAAPMSPLNDVRMERVEESPQQESNNQKRKPLRRDDGSTGSTPSLEQLLQSSQSDTDNSEGDNDSGTMTLNDAKPKPVSSSSTRLSNAHTQRRSRSKSTGRLSMSRTPRSKSTGRLSTRGTAVESRRTSILSNGITVAQTSSKQDSFADKIEDLREDNTAEHNLFRDDADQQLYSYDMRIRVIVRKRPVSKAEKNSSGGTDVIHPLDYGDYGRILAYQPKTRVDLTKEVETVPFAYDNVFDETSTNVQIYQRSLRNLIKPFFHGQWSTVFAYGQTGSGKTYTMMGSNMTGINAGTATSDSRNFGLYYLAALDVFEKLKLPEYQHLTVQASLFEIYGGKLFDLLNGRKQVKCLEDSRNKVCFPGLTEHTIDDAVHLMEMIEEGASNRSTGTTSRNADSSRSHAVLQLKLKKEVGRRRIVEHGRLNFIDLAGSERGDDTSSASRATRLEGAEINTSLLALKEVIRALATGGSMTHIPFRGSKLTQVLKDSFVGENSRCCMVACVSPDINNCEQTLNTLRYADRVKERNSDTGALASRVDQPTRLAPISNTSPTQAAASVSPLESPLNDEEMNEDLTGDENFVDSDQVFQSPAPGDRSILEDLLKDDSIVQETSEHVVPPSPVGASSRQVAGEMLVGEHQSAVASMLAMVKNEMDLVNRVDADREKLDDYLTELQEVQISQLRLIQKLRGSLQSYVNIAEGNEIIERTAESVSDNDDDSFEDLRD